MTDLARDLGETPEAARLVDHRRREHEAESLRLLQQLQSQAHPGIEQDALARIAKLGERYVAALAASPAPLDPPASPPDDVHLLQFKLFEAINEAHDQQQVFVEQMVSRTASDSRQATRLLTSLAVVLGFAAIGVSWAASGLARAARHGAAEPQAPAEHAGMAHKKPAGEPQDDKESQILESIHLVRQTLDELVREAHRSSGRQEK